MRSHNHCCFIEWKLLGHFCFYTFSLLSLFLLQPSNCVYVMFSDPESDNSDSSDSDFEPEKEVLHTLYY